MTDINKTNAAPTNPAVNTKPAPAAAAAKPAVAPKPKAKKEDGDETGRGRKSQYSGMVLRSTVDVNPRRADTHGAKSFGIVLAAGKAGISYEEYTAKGGRLNDLVWDINKDHIEATKN